MKDAAAPSSDSDSDSDSESSSDDDRPLKKKARISRDDDSDSDSSSDDDAMLAAKHPAKGKLDKKKLGTKTASDIYSDDVPLGKKKTKATEPPTIDRVASSDSESDSSSDSSSGESPKFEAQCRSQ
jgi:nucleolin